MVLSAVIADGVASLLRLPHCAYAQGGLAIAAWNIENIGGLAKTGKLTAKSSNNLLALLDIEPEVAGAGRKIRMVQIVWLDAALNKGPHQVRQNSRVIIDALQQYSLAEESNSGIGQSCASVAGILRHLTRMVGVNRDINRLAAAFQCVDQCRIDMGGIDHGNTRVKADDLDVVYLF